MIELQDRVAKMFGKEAALFVASGTMSNAIALRTHTVPGDEIVCDKTAHIYRYEGGGYARFVRRIRGAGRGHLRLDDA